MKVASKKDKRRVFVLIIALVPLLVFFVVNMFNYWSQIYKNINEREELKISYKKVLETESDLKNEITKLQDPDYVARYAREKYLYSKDGEIIIKID